MSPSSADAPSFSRRRWLGAAAASMLVGGCRRERNLSEGLRIGFLPNIGHAVPLVVARGDERARWRERAGAIEMVPFSAGPAVMEALAAGELDLAYVGPPPAINAFLRSRHDPPHILAGAASGGASLVVREGLTFRSATDLHGRIVASPQLGNTQDVALRAYLAESGVLSRDRGGDVGVVPLTNADALVMLKRGRLDGAWVPEPWATRMVLEARAQRVIDERELWTNGRFPTAVLVVTQRALSTARPQVDAILAAHRETTARLAAAPDAVVEVGEAMAAVLGKRLPIALLREAWGRFELTTDPCLDGLERTAKRMRALAYLPSDDVTGLVVSEPAPRAEVVR